MTYYKLYDGEGSSYFVDERTAKSIQAYLKGFTSDEPVLSTVELATEPSPLYKSPERFIKKHMEKVEKQRAEEEAGM